jgi:uncharacterized membrane protein YfcA
MAAVGAARGFGGFDLRLPWLITASFIGGALNAVAGGGSFLTFPAMLGVGLGPIQANATNTVALWPGQLTSIAGYRDEVRKQKALAVRMAGGGLVGGTAGALVLLHTPAATFLNLVPWLLLFAALIFAVSDPVMRWLARRAAAKATGNAVMEAKPRNRWPLVAATAAICFYIGYFGAGAGFLIISLLSVFGFQDLHEMNAMKVVSTTMANGVACLLFAFSGKVEWHFCLAAMGTCAAGGYLSARVAKRVNPRVLRMLVVCIGLGMAGYFFWRNHH